MLNSFEPPSGPGNSAKAKWLFRHQDIISLTLIKPLLLALTKVEAKTTAAFSTKVASGLGNELQLQTGGGAEVGWV